MFPRSRAGFVLLVFFALALLASAGAPAATVTATGSETATPTSTPLLDLGLATETPTPTATPSPTPTATATPSPTPTATPSAITAKIDPALLEQMAADGDKLLPIIVEMGHARPPFPKGVNALLAQRALDLIGQHGGEPVGGLALIDAAAGWAEAATIEAISLDSAVAFIHQDDVLRPRRGSEPRTIWPPGLLSAPYPRVVKADKVWLPGTTGQGITGQGITVAVLDSGVASDPDLAPDRILQSVSFAGPRDPLRPDPGGHGTHVGGIIAGDGTRSEGEYVGIAPRANLVDVRVLNGNGNGRVSSVVRGIEWVLAHQTEYNIRVANLSFGAPARRSYRLDPLTAAVEIAWKRGVVVVAAAGNGGPNSGTVETPGIGPYPITVGATDDQGSLPLSDDELAWFSAWGTPPDSTPKPDLVAPGRRIVSLRTTGSYLDTLFPDRVVVAKNGTTYFRLTGTSMSTPMVSGAAALLLERQPDLSPDQVKAILLGTTQPYGEASKTPLPDPSADGQGLLDADAAVNSSRLGSANQGLRPADAFARTLYALLYGQPLTWKDPNYLGIDWNSLTWETLTWDNMAYDNLDWDAFDWANLAWENMAYDNMAYDNVAWDRTGWDALSWDSLTLD